ncbi:alpha/beta hydrolase [Nostoc sp. LEGE 12447]|uniref:alpha/beta hydrolase n=1 Tax=Nostoc sp. LEGE 12447 TaxID=1828640 RepID=UPI001883F3D0|nr:alpha/beta hydrolase [Nostoc sp. LEGE 12447]MBE8997981.1 alpha/beta hydrolase [Nostoc sp. LEGE 12447]
MINEIQNTQIDSSNRQIPLIIIDKFRPLNVEDEILGYIAISTATDNAEDDEYKSLLANLNLSANSPEARAENLVGQTESCLQEIAVRLSELQTNDPEIVIAVHGFNNKFNSVRAWYEDIHHYINADSTTRKRNLIFIGYRWPSENFIDHLILSIVHAFEALPVLPKNIFFLGLLISLLLLTILLNFYTNFLVFSFGLTTIITSLILTLIILRLIVYFRDTYRSAYFGTPDLVELVRQLDRVILQHNPNNKVKLSFLGHSLGCSVITNAIRILSDAFDPLSIGTLNTYQTGKRPTNEIGRIFQLERLVLVAPDIPVESVIPRRSNFLRSAIRRVKEAHVFTNEGDLALRLASTAANYFSFPAKTRFSGYRLGNLTVKHFKNYKDKLGFSPQYGIINNLGPCLNLPFKHLEIRSSNAEHRELEEQPFYPWVAKNPNDVTNRFSYYDCTDYSDYNDLTSCYKGIVSLAVSKPSLNLLDYGKLFFAYVLNTFNSKVGVDTHGGYFQGKFGKDLIYRLAFAGFTKLRTSLHPKTLDQVCQEKKIQVVLSPDNPFS